MRMEACTYKVSTSPDLHHMQGEAADELLSRTRCAPTNFSHMPPAATTVPLRSRTDPSRSTERRALLSHRPPRFPRLTPRRITKMDLLQRSSPMRVAIRNHKSHRVVDPKRLPRRSNPRHPYPLPHTHSTTPPHTHIHTYPIHRNSTALERTPQHSYTTLHQPITETQPRTTTPSDARTTTTLNHHSPHTAITPTFPFQTKTPAPLTSQPDSETRSGKLPSTPLPQPQHAPTSTHSTHES